MNDFMEKATPYMICALCGSVFLLSVGCLIMMYMEIAASAPLCK